MTVAEYLDLALPQNCVWTTFPAGGGGAVRGKILKAMGLKPDWPDIQILIATSWPSPQFVCLELKAPKKYATASQRDCHEAIRKVGGHVFVVKTLTEIYRVLSPFVSLKAKP